MSYFNLNQTYLLETKESKEHIIATLGIIVDLNKSKKGISSYFQYPDYTSILLSDNKIIINNVVLSSISKNVIGEIHVSLTTAPEGTLIVADSRPYEPPITIMAAGAVGGVLIWFLLYYEHVIKLPQNEFLALIIGFMLLCVSMVFIVPKMIKKAMKSYLDTVFFQLQLSSKFVLVEKEQKRTG